MTWKSSLLAALAVFTALLVQRSALPLFDLPGGAPVPILVIVVAFALVKGPFGGCVVGFCAGLFADVAPPATHGVGREAFVLCLVGYWCGKLAGEVDRSALAPVAIVAVATAATIIGNGVVGSIFGGGHLSLRSLVTQVPAVVLYDVLLAPFIVPGIAVLVRRLDPEPRR